MAEKRNPRIVLGVTGSIAAFRAADLASAMVQEGWEVHAILTADGARFITPLTLAAKACPKRLALPVARCSTLPT
jgi:phosphopantothenoylcysteine synthetase/decarboxylase